MSQLTDTLTFNTDLYITKAEAAITVTDTPKATKVYNVNKAEPAISVSDNTLSVSVSTSEISKSEAAIGVADSAPTVSVEATVTPAINKEEAAIGTTDTPTIGISPSEISVSDTIGSLDTANVSILSQVAVSDSTSLSDDPPTVSVETLNAPIPVRRNSNAVEAAGTPTVIQASSQ